MNLATNSNTITLTLNTSKIPSSGTAYLGGVETQILFIIIVLISLVGNMLVIILFIYSHKLRSYSHGVLIWNLALVDVLTDIFIIVTPAHIIRDAFPLPPPGIAGELFCKLIGAETFTFSFGFISMSILAILSIERCYAIIKPSRHTKLFSIRNAKIMVILAWIWGIALIATNIIQGQLIVENNSRRCGWASLPIAPDLQKLVYAIMFVLRFVLPMMCIIICYSSILTHMRSTIRNLAAVMDRKETAAYKVTKKVTIMCAMTSLAFLICWLPNQIYFTLINFGVIAEINGDIHFMTKVLIIFNSCVNPFIYACTNRYYRQEFMKMIKMCGCAKSQARVTAMGSSTPRTFKSWHESKKSTNAS